MLIKKTLQQLKIDAYVIYDFRGSNFLGREIIDFRQFTTRRFFSILTQDGPHHLIPKIEAHNFDKLEGIKHVFGGYAELHVILKELLPKFRTIAVDTSSNNDLPIVDLMPAGVLTLFKKTAPKTRFVSSEELTARIAALWGEAGYKSHKAAAQKLQPIFDSVFEQIKKSLKDGKTLSDYDVMQEVVKRQHEANLHNDGENLCIIATNQRSANPHYWPKLEENYPILPNSALLVDIWARTKDTNSVYADFTMYAWIGPDPVPKKIASAWQALIDAQNLALELLNQKVKSGLQGFELDKIIRTHLLKHGYEKNILHRSGHSLGTREHGNGANLDDFETHDTRPILPNTGFTMEPGIFFENEYGVRGEIDIYIHPDYKVEITTPKQNAIILL